MKEIGPQLVIKKMVELFHPKANSAEFDIGPHVFQIMFWVKASILNIIKMYLKQKDEAIFSRYSYNINKLEKICAVAQIY